MYRIMHTFKTGETKGGAPIYGGEYTGDTAATPDEALELCRALKTLHNFDCWCCTDSFGYCAV